ncbi:hypothetical protein GCM10010232_49590 [Streptomyces amakusaensis]|uniref:Uncharacterized protein n=1 Tax=Streptomyces amakusaensis TaxID=67271 RepID=A0ABW0AK43_9ACTN
MFKRRREARERQDLQRAGQEMWSYFRSIPTPLEELDEEEARERAAADPEPAVAEPVAAVDDFLPPDFVAPSQREMAGLMMAWPGPLVVDGEIITCSHCETYRDWVVLSLQGRVWLRCRAGHETHGTGLDTAWFNRNSGPMTEEHASYQDGIRFLGH